MAFLRETLEMFLSGVKVEVAKGCVVVLYRGDARLAHVRVTTLEDADRLEAIAKTPRVYGIWRPNYRYEGEALSVSEFGALVAKDPAKFAYVKETPVKADPVAARARRGAQR